MLIRREGKSAHDNFQGMAGSQKVDPILQSPLDAMLPHDKLPLQIITQLS
jgi:hypothetical protein